MATPNFSELSLGAEFRRADLHIHSYGEFGSYDVTDTSMTPEGIVDEAIAQNLSVIAIADHNEIGNVQRAVTRASGKPILVVPAVELSTPQGHLLMYFRDYQSLRTFYGKLQISPDRTACSDTLEQCLALCDKYDGFGVLAHIELASGFDVSMPKFNAFKEAVVSCPALLGLEITQKVNSNVYSLLDSNPDRKRLFELRVQQLVMGPGHELAKVMNSDAHSINMLGRNATGNKKLTRFKMESLTFDALRLALHDASARVRLEEVVPQDVPRFVGMKLTGGLLHEQSIRFSKNLTCIIGGRGSGKSTMMECLRVSAGTTIRRKDLVDSEIWPDRIDLVYKDAAGQEHHLCRESGSDTENLTDPFNGITSVPIESYGQGDTAETIQHCDKDPGILLQFLDTFIGLEGLKARDEEVRDLLLSNQTQIEKLSLEVNRIPEIDKAKKHAESQVQALKDKDATELVGLEGKLANGRKFRTSLMEDLTERLKTARTALDGTKSLTELVGGDGSNLPVGIEDYKAVRDTVTDLAEQLEKDSNEVKKHCNASIGKLDTHFKSWRAGETKIQTRIDEIRKELEEKGVHLDVSFIKKVTTDVAEYTTKLAQLKQKSTELIQRRAERKTLIDRRASVKGEIFKERSRLAVRLEEALKQTVEDFSISVKYDEGRHSPQMEEIIKDAMEWRTSKVPKAGVIAAAMSPLELASCVQKKDSAALERIDIDGSTIFNKGEAELIIERLSADSILFSIERCDFEDRPKITLARAINEPSGKVKVLKKDFGKLSLGQQQSILLSIMLFSPNKYPLVIDQPEDNLDSEFVYKTFVKTLRAVKETRQVIVVTHNSNIAVLGDAELILPLKATNERSKVMHRGSIDSTETRKLTCAILEGSEEAFKRRMRIYGLG